MEPYAGDAARRMLVVSDHYDEAGAELVVDEVLDRLSLDDALTLCSCHFSARSATAGRRACSA